MKTKRTTEKKYLIFQKVFKQEPVWLSTAKGLYLFDNKNNDIVKASLKYRKLSAFDEYWNYLQFWNRKMVSLWLATGKGGLIFL